MQIRAMRALCAKSAHVPEYSEHTLLVLTATELDFYRRFCSKRGIFAHCSFPECYVRPLFSEQRWLFAMVVCRRPNERSAAYYGCSSTISIRTSKCSDRNCLGDDAVGRIRWANFAGLRMQQWQQFSVPLQQQRCEWRQPGCPTQLLCGETGTHSVARSIDRPMCAWASRSPLQASRIVFRHAGHADAGGK